MEFKDYSIHDIYKECHNGRVLICFGAGQALGNFFTTFRDISVDKFISAIADNGKIKGQLYKLNGREIPIKYINEIVQSIDTDKRILVLITCQYLSSIWEQLNHIQNLQDRDVTVGFYGFVMDRFSEELVSGNLVNITIPYNDTIQIPKKIHYCWFGKNEIPSRYREWMKSWKKYCPDYEIIEWNEDNYDVTKNNYMREAYESGKWGFVPDYARLDIIYEHGGVYLDTDVELVRSLDPLMHQDGFIGFQETGVNLGLGFGAVPHNPVIRCMLEDYNKRQFIKEDGSMDQTSSPLIQTECLMKVGLEANGRYQQLPHMNVFPRNFFSPMNHYNRKIIKNDNTFSIHHFDGSWLDDDRKKEVLGYYDFYKKYIDSLDKVPLI